MCVCVFFYNKDIESVALLTNDDTVSIMCHLKRKVSLIITGFSSFNFIKIGIGISITPT